MTKYTIKSQNNTLHRYGGNRLGWSNTDWQTGKQGEPVTFDTEAEALAFLAHPSRQITFYRDTYVGSLLALYPAP